MIRDNVIQAERAMNRSHPTRRLSGVFCTIYRSTYNTYRRYLFSFACFWSHISLCFALTRASLHPHHTNAGMFVVQVVFERVTGVVRRFSSADLGEFAPLQNCPHFARKIQQKCHGLWELKPIFLRAYDWLTFQPPPPRHCRRPGKVERRF